MIRIGVLGAAKITRGALLRPASRVDGVLVHAVAARDPARARTYAHSNQIPVVHDNYQQVLDDPEIDAVYIPLPAALHAEWTLAAIAAGKHVLCEKPFTANAEQATIVERAASQSSVVVMEAYHSGHHPTLEQLREILASGVLGEVLHASAAFCVLIPPGKDIRWNAALGGGGLLDVGYYPLRLLRDLLGEPTIVGASALESHGIDRSLTAQLDFPSGARGEVVSAIWSRHLLSGGLSITGSKGHLSMMMPYHAPRLGGIRVRAHDARFVAKTDQKPTYDYQLEAFRDSIVTGATNSTDAPAAVRQLAAIDKIYRAAGMSPRNLSY